MLSVKYILIVWVDNSLYVMDDRRKKNGEQLLLTGTDSGKQYKSRH